MPKKVVILTTGQPSTNPRMVKEYKALKEAGYKVKVLYSYWDKWAVEADRKLFEAGVLDAVDFSLIAGSPFSNKPLYLVSKVLQKGWQLMHKLAKNSYSSYSISRVAFFLERAAVREKAEIYIGHNLGALQATVKAAKKHSAKAVFDVEDYYSGQYGDTAGTGYKINRDIEAKYLPICDGITYSSPEIKDAYKTISSGRKSEIVLNVVERKFVAEELASLPLLPVKLVWFSQQVGPKRGIETVIEALNTLDEYRYEIHLLGNCSDSYKQLLLELSNKRRAIVFHKPVPYSAIPGFLSDKHIGLATETARDANNDMALSNKIFSYLAAGNVVIATDTTAQKNFLTQHTDAGFVYKKNDKEACAALLKELFDNPEKVIAARNAAVNLAKQQYNWSIEGRKFVNLIDGL